MDKKASNKERMNLMDVIAEDKGKVAKGLKEKREELIELHGKTDVLSKSTEPHSQTVGIIMHRTCLELLQLWDALGLVIGSIFELREGYGGLLVSLSALSTRSGDVTLKREVDDLKMKFKSYEPTFEQIKGVIDKWKAQTTESEKGLKAIGKV